jgi:hypothetical protein
MAIAAGYDILNELAKKTGAPLKCRRMIIDIAADEAVIIYYETYADKQVFDVDITKGAKAISVSDVCKPFPKCDYAAGEPINKPDREPEILCGYFKQTVSQKYCCKCKAGAVPENTNA